MGARGLIGAGLGVGPQAPEFPELRDEFIARYEAAMLVHTRLFDGMAEVLDALDATGVRWGVVSNKIERFVRPIVAHLGLAERCGCTIGGDTTPTPKPHPAPLLLAAQQVGVLPSDCTYVGDDLRDIQAGRAAGMRTVAAAYGYCGDDPPATQWQADLVVESVGDLLALIR
jgi:phosphoglycolate phosphatase